MSHPPQTPTDEALDALLVAINDGVRVAPCYLPDQLKEARDKILRMGAVLKNLVWHIDQQECATLSHTIGAAEEVVARLQAGRQIPAITELNTLLRSILDGDFEQPTMLDKINLAQRYWMERNCRFQMALDRLQERDDRLRELLATPSPD